MASNHFDPDAPPDGRSKKAEPEDPMTLTGMVVPLSAAEEQEAADKMAETFVEEYALMGWPGSQIRLLFKSPLYVGPHAIYTRWGLAVVDELIREIFRVEEVADGAGS